MRRLQECMGSGDSLPTMERCYYEHESDTDKEVCDKLHMKYDTRLDFGTFE